MHNDKLDAKLGKLNANAKDEKRHSVESADNPVCLWCGKKLNRHYCIKFANQICPELSKSVDRRGSATRSQKVSEVRAAALQLQIDQRNLTAVAKQQRFIISLNPPRCQYCSQEISRASLKNWMTRQCPELVDAFKDI